MTLEKAVLQIKEWKQKDVPRYDTLLNQLFGDKFIFIPAISTEAYKMTSLLTNPAPTYGRRFRAEYMNIPLGHPYTHPDDIIATKVVIHTVAKDDPDLLFAKIAPELGNLIQLEFLGEGQPIDINNSITEFEGVGVIITAAEHDHTDRRWKPERITLSIDIVT